jgi:hypothetical protein
VQVFAEHTSVTWRRKLKASEGGLMAGSVTGIVKLKVERLKCKVQESANG